MSADLETFRLALRAPLRAMSGYIGDTRVQWENHPFKPPTLDPTTPASSLWIREHLVTGSERKTSTGFVESMGLYYLYANAPSGMGSKLAHDLAKAIMDVYPPTTHLPAVKAHLYRTERLPARMEGRGADGSSDPVWYSVPVLVYWRLFSAVPTGA